ncbi:lysylphosphatidylglycerol synthase transmembrane domain-containing protein [Chryseobacterium tongliaoense]|uniref:lysylphosphatidylglycerol synthase transmembrane domain-containing protein n=1 Tax=Chryseobacterium tongliaoense TaxID=3240933 RepID=UPI0035165ACA
MEKKNTKKIFTNILKIFVSIVLLYFVFRKIPLQDVAKIWSTLNVWYAIPAAVFFLASQVLSTKRLEFYLRANDFNLNFKSNLELYFLGMFYNFFIPGGIGGDAYKIYILNKKLGWSLKKLTSAIFNDRLSGLLAISVLILRFSIFLLPAKWILLPVIMIIMGILLTYFMIRKLFSVYRTIFIKTFLISVLIQILQVICFLFLLKSLGVNENFTVYIITFLGSSILSLLSFAGIGVREFLFLQASKYFNFDASVSVSASLLFTVVTIFFSLFGLISIFKKNHLKSNNSLEEY